MDQVDKLEKKLEKMYEELAKINITLVSQHHTLKEHMKRSEANEKAIEIIKNELIPVQQHVNGLNYLLKALGVVSVILGLVAALFKVKDLLF